MDITFICKMYCKSFFLFSPVPWQTDVLYQMYTVNFQSHKLEKQYIYLFSSLNVLIMVATENLLKLGCTLCPASLIVIPWTRTVARIWSEITILGLALRCPCTLHPRPPHLTRTLPPLPLTLFPSIVGINIQRTWAPCVLWTVLYSRQLIWSHH